jgi:hypothetical protein
MILVGILLSACVSFDAKTAPPPSIDPGVDPNSWVLVPAGEFLMGLHNHETYVAYDYGKLSQRSSDS